VDVFCAQGPKRTIEMRIEPAVPWTFPRAAPRERALRWFAAAATVFVATVAILGAAMAAVMLGIS